MSAEILNVANGVLTLKVSGQLTHVELTDVQNQADEILRSKGKLSILVLAQNFTGWERGADWGDSPFQAERDAHIARMAIVGDAKWEDLAAMFTAKWLREFPIEYFETSKLAAAQAWLADA